MRRWASKAAAVLGVALSGALAAADTARIEVNVAKPAIRVSPKLYGIFFEEINHAGDGGLYAEMIRNRSFADSDKPDGWAAEGDASLTIDTAHPLSSATPHSLRVDAHTANAGAASLGYWGIGVKAGYTYRCSFYARASQPLLALSVSLGGVGHARAGAPTPIAISESWRRYEIRLSAEQTTSSARLVFAATRPGTFWLDAVSLMPLYPWKGRSNGLREDLAEKLAGIRPAFVRFPGGCYCEGEVLKDAFRWKYSIGPIEARPGHWNLWGYRSTDGLGFHEYLQMCEDLGAEPLFVINCGMSHKENVPLEQLGPWVQDALDAIEYANGTVSSKWGALRAKAGHPKPFNLKYMEIGNENGGPVYETHFAAFYDAIKKRYPQIRLVANVPVQSRRPDLIDEHYYSSPSWFLSQDHHYDDYDRSGPPIYVGEYAVTQQCGQGNLRAALGEAAFMTGMERNSDIVQMASYAPLFVNVNNRAWNPDAICYDSSRCYGTPSYWVQQMFSRNRADTILPLTLRCDRDPLSNDTPASGGIGLGTWATQAEFKDVTVTGGNVGSPTVDFASGAPGWHVIRGDWKSADGVYRQTSMETDVRSVLVEPTWSDYTIHLKARKLGGAEGFLIMFRVTDDSNWFWWNIGGWGNREHAIEKCEGGSKTTLGRSVPGSVEIGRWYDIRIQLEGPRIRCYLDGKLIHDQTDAPAIPMAAVAGSDRTAGQIVLKVVNTSEQPVATMVRLDGAASVQREGDAEVLTAPSMDEENSLDRPERVVPVKQKVGDLGTDFLYRFPARSVTILRIRAAPVSRP